VKDRLWRAVYGVLRPLLNSADMVLAPRGDWPCFPCSSVLYDDVIDLAGCTVLVLHKGQMAGIEKADLLRIANEWQWVFANEVFVVLSRDRKIGRDARRGPQLVHCKPLIRFLCSRNLRKRRSKLIYVHVPKTGGTSMWAALTKALPSHIYFTSLRALSKHPPVLEDYDLIGVHFSPAVLLQHLSEDDLVIGMVREPTQRFLSGILHARRESEDPETFTPSTKAMREMELIEYLATDFGRFEARLQLITFGLEHAAPLSMPSDDRLYASAVTFAKRRNVILAPSERSDAFREFLRERLSVQIEPLARLNASEARLWATYRSEFDRAGRLIRSTNAREPQFYDFVSQSYSELASRETSRPRGLLASPRISTTFPHAVMQRARAAAVRLRGGVHLKAPRLREVSRSAGLTKL
jgi:hypothetical protein